MGVKKDPPPKSAEQTAKFVWQPDDITIEPPGKAEDQSKRTVAKKVGT